MGARLRIIISDNIKMGSNDNGVKNSKFFTYKNLVVRSTKFPQRDIRKYTWTSPDGKVHNQIDHVVIDRWHSSILDVRSFRGADCDTDHYLVVARVREGLAASKLVAQKYDMEKSNLRKLNELEVRKHYDIKILTGLQLW